MVYIGSKNGHMILHLRENIKKILRERGLAQKEIAAKLGVTREHVSGILTGKSAMTESMIEKIAGILNVSANDLFLAPGTESNVDPETEEDLSRIKFLMKNRDTKTKLMSAVIDLEEYWQMKQENMRGQTKHR